MPVYDADRSPLAKLILEIDGQAAALKLIKPMLEASTNSYTDKLKQLGMKVRVFIND